MNIDATYTLHTGRSMPVMGVGTWQLEDDTAGAVAHALESGYRMVEATTGPSREWARVSVILTCAATRCTWLPR